LQEYLRMSIVTCLYQHHPEALPLSSNVGNVERGRVDVALNDLGLVSSFNPC
jgi:enhanced disease susceptibility 1 protein